MRGDLAAEALLGLLLLLVLPSTGLPALVGPVSPDAYLVVAVLLTGLFVLVVGPRLEGPGPGRPLALFVAALPFLVYGAVEAPTVEGTRPVPGLGFWLLVVLGLGLAGLRRRPARLIVAAVLTLLAADALLLGAGLRILPRGSNALDAPTAWAGPTPAEIVGEAVDDPVRTGLKVGAPVPVEGETGRLLPAARGRFPASEPLYPVLGANGGMTGPEEGVGTFLPGEEVWGLASPLELDPFDAVLVLPGDWDGRSAEAERVAQALATYVQRGGLLVGPGPGREWPEPLGRKLGSAGRGWAEGLAGARPMGLGLVARAGSEGAIRDLLRDARDRPRLETVLDGARPAPPPLPPALSGWTNRPASRRAQGLLLLVYALVVVLLDRILRGTFPRLMGLVAPAVAVAFGLAWTSPGDDGVRAHAIALDLGGGGGRRIEAVVLAAGPQGWVGPLAWRGGGFERLVGAARGADGRIRIHPGRTAWAVREQVGRGGRPPERETRDAGFLRGLLRGPVDPTRLRFGRGRPLDVRVGADLPPHTWILRYR